MLHASLELSQRIELATANSSREFIEARRRLEPELGAAWLELAGAVACFDGPDSPITQVFGLGMTAAATPEVLTRIEAFFNDRDAHTDLEVSPFSGVDSLALLAGRGYRPIELSSVLYRELETVAPPPSEVEVSLLNPVRDLDSYRQWVEVNSRAWTQEPEFTEMMAALSRASGSAVGALPYLARIDGVPAATAMLHIHEGLACLDGAATLPEFRGRGAQAALLAARLEYGKRNGCDAATMSTQPGSQSQRNAERAGFRVAYTRIKWRRERP